MNNIKSDILKILKSNRSLPDQIFSEDYKYFYFFEWPIQEVFLESLYVANLKMKRKEFYAFSGTLADKTAIQLQFDNTLLFSDNLKLFTKLIDQSEFANAMGVFNIYSNESLDWIAVEVIPEELGVLSFKSEQFLEGFMSALDCSYVITWEDVSTKMGGEFAEPYKDYKSL